ncbi:MAG: biotin/lipoyl-binding protein, partial [Firmicutes bacterium]|nr:biotin/lipoyl-binding protein [Bacillota bacterium]
MEKYLKLTAAVLSAFIMLTGCGGDTDPGGIPEGEPTQEEKVTPVKTTKIELSSISNEYMYSGSIEPSDEVNVTCKLSGKVSKVNFDVGDTVNEGDILFVMDTEDIENDIKAAQAGVKSAQTGVDTAENNLKMANGASMQSQLDNAKNAITNAENSLERAKISLDNAQKSVDNAQIALDNSKINLDKAQKTYEDNVTLYDGGVITEEELINSKNAYDEAKNSYSQAELSLQQAKNQYSIEQSQYDSANDSLMHAQKDHELLANETSQENTIKAEDNLKQSKAQLESSNVQLEKTMQSLNDAYVRAPISGVVSKRNVTAGTNLSQSEAPFVIINTDSVDVKVNV